MLQPLRPAVGGLYAGRLSISGAAPTRALFVKRIGSSPYTYS